MKPDLVKVVLFILASILVGWGFNLALEFGLFAAFLSNVWLLLRAKRLHDWFSNKNQLPYAEQGVFYSLHRDIKTMREKHKKQKRALQKTLKDFREASSVLPDAIVMVNKTGEITWSNTLAYKLLGIQFPRDSGHRVSNLIRTPAFVEAFANHKETPVNIDIVAPNQIETMINLKVIDLAQKTQMLVARDITRHTNIQRAQKDFVSNVSHELKTPLTVMHGYLEMLADHPNINEDFKKPISDMSLQAKRMQSTINDLLYLAKLESQPRGTDPQNQHEPISIISIIEMIMDSSLILAKQQQQTIVTNIDDRLSITGNRSELQIAFSNLITNAIRYTPRGGKITVKWYQEDDNAIFSVNDDGIGIAPNHIARLTERFYRVDQGRSREKGGTGLGLSIVKNVLERHNASLKIRSSLGNGSCFECVFPLLSGNT